MKVLHQNVIEFLEKEGFKPSTSGLSLYDCDLFYYKRTKYDDTKDCVCNDGVPQICVKAYSCDVQGRTCTSYSIEICQENDLGWIKFDYYGIKEEQLINNFDQYEESLIKSWEASFRGE